MNKNNNDIQERGEGDWEKLYQFMDENDFSNADFLACICANLTRQEGKKFSTRIMVAGVEFQIDIAKVKEW